MDFQAYKDASASKKESRERQQERYFENEWDKFWADAFFNHEDVTIDYITFLDDD